MSTKMKLFGIGLVAVLAVVALGAGIAFAQTPTPNNGVGFGWMMGGNARNGYGPGMMGGNAQNGGGWEWMNAMHQWMAASGGMHTFVWNTLAEKLGLTSDELVAEVNSGKTIAQIAEEKDVSRADLVAALETAHQDSLAQAVSDGYLTQEQADSILTQMAGRYEWMLDNMGAGYGMMGRYNGGSNGNGQFGPGGCHGNWNGGAADSQPRP